MQTKDSHHQYDSVVIACAKFCGDHTQMIPYCSLGMFLYRFVLGKNTFSQTGHGNILGPAWL